MLIDGSIDSGVLEIKRRGGKDPDPRGKVLQDLESWLVDRFEYDKTDLVVYEAPHQRGGAATFFGQGMAAMVERLAYVYDCAVSTEHTMTIKKFAAGAAKITDGKSQTLARAQQFDPSITSDDQADALCLLLYVMGQKGITTLPPHGGDNESDKCPLCYRKPRTDIESGVECCINVCNPNAESLNDHIIAWNEVAKRFNKLKCPKCGNKAPSLIEDSFETELVCSCGHRAKLDFDGFTWIDLFDKFEGIPHGDSK